MRHSGPIPVSILMLCGFVLLLPYAAWMRELGGVSLSYIMMPTLLMAVVVGTGSTIRLWKPTVLLLVFLALSTLSSGYSDEGKYLPIFINLLGYLLFCNLVYNLVTEIRHLELVGKALLVGMASVSILVVAAVNIGLDVGSMIGLPMVFDFFLGKRVVGTENNPNGFAMLFVSVPAFAVAYLFTEKRTIVRLLLVASLVLFAIILFYTVSRSALLGALIGVLVVAYWCRPGIGTRSAVLIGLPAGILTAFYLPELVTGTSWATSFFIDPAGLLADKAMAVQIRILYADIVADLITDNFFIGVGYGNLGNLIADSELSQNLGAHNIFLAIGAEFGFIALAFFLAFLTSVILELVRALMAAKGDPRQVAIGATLLGGLIGQLANGMFHESYIQIQLWLLIGLAGAYSRIIQTSRQQAAQPSGPVMGHAVATVP